ncbi:hypothetical protein ACFL34_00510 [Candidatus Sumerlaeota bacterium]
MTKPGYLLRDVAKHLANGGEATGAEEPKRDIRTACHVILVKDVAGWRSFAPTVIDHLGSSDAHLTSVSMSILIRIGPDVISVLEDSYDASPVPSRKNEKIDYVIDQIQNDGQGPFAY